MDEKRLDAFRLCMILISVFLVSTFLIPSIADSITTEHPDYPGENGTSKAYKWSYNAKGAVSCGISPNNTVTLEFSPSEYDRAQRCSHLLNALYYSPSSETMKYLANNILDIESSLISDLADTFSERTASMSDLDRAGWVLAFVQSIPYVSDFASTGKLDYWKSAYETLYCGGDCEDLSILYAKIMQKLGYDVILVHAWNPDSESAHVCAAVNIPEAEGFYFEYNDVCYYYCETVAGTHLANPWGRIGNAAGWNYTDYEIIDISPDSPYKEHILDHLDYDMIFKD